VNSGKFYVVEDDGHYLTPKQVKAFKSELRDFPQVGLYKDQVDATADAVRHLLKLSLKGRVINVNGEHNLLPWSRFIKRIGPRIPGHWDVGIACCVGANSSLPSGWALVAHAAENANLGEAIVVVASTRKYVNDPGIILSELKQAANIYCEKGMQQVDAIWIAHGNDAVIALAQDKYDLAVHEFEGDASTA